ncbi:MAG: triose-phosphate isomerase [Acidobacteria bacterium]|nr:triose-phosphate isomerase [Acidobacteriota bacterium]
MRVPIIAGNWKMHKTVGEARQLARSVRDGAKSAAHCTIVLAPPYTALQAVGDEIAGSPLVLAAQNVHWEPKGAFTGEISIPMLEDLGCRMAIVGHSERRQYSGETDRSVNLRVRALLQSSLAPLLCVGETLEQRESGDYHKTVFQQLTGGLDGLTPREVLRIILAYEPVWAIGTGRTATPETAQEMHRAIRSWLAQGFGREVSDEVRILYGGSVKPDNMQGLMNQPDIDGALVGGACLEADGFLRIIAYDTTGTRR